MMPGVAASEGGSPAPLPTYAAGDVVFQGIFDGVDSSTVFFDESPLHATLTNHGCVLSSEQTILNCNTSLRCDAITDYITAPPNVLYNIGTGGDFTVETRVRVPSFALFFPMQLIGVWKDEVSPNTQQWRFLIDSLRVYFQCRLGGGIQQFSAPHLMLTNSWRHMAVSRYLGTIRIYVNGAMVYKFAMVNGPFDTPVTPTNLYIGGNEGQYGCNAFISNMRVTLGALYRDDAGFVLDDEKIGHGFIYPGTLAVSDTFYAPAAAEAVMSPALFTDPLTVFAPDVKRTPAIVNTTVTNGGVGGVAGVPTLAPSRVNGNLLIAFIQTVGGSKTFSVGGGWTIGDTSTDANSSTAWAWRIVDGTEAAPTFTWTGASTWHGKMYQFAWNNAVAPIGAKHNALGASANLIINGGVGLTTTAALSMAFAITLTSANSQTLPLPAGFTAAGVAFGDSNGSDRASYQSLVASGAVSSPVSLTISSAFWHGFLIEILR